jgi:asparagine synthase (glutamine-hydrolysing)
MLDRTKHRGPDQSEAVIFDGKSALGMNRLAIMSPYEDATIQKSAAGNYAMFNGEIVNHQALRTMLKNPPKEKSDTALILPLYEQRGQNFAKDLAGMFAITIYNPQKRTLQLWRDPLGIKPLYFYNSEGRIIISSEIKAIAAVVPHEPRVDFSAIDDGLKYRFHPGRLSVFPEIQRVLPGETVIFDHRGMSRKQFWTLGENSQSPEKDNAIEEFRNILVQVIKEHTQADVPGGFFVSGGLDSSLVTAIALKETNSSPFQQPISLRFLPDAVEDERYATLMEKVLDRPFEWVDVTDEIARQTLMDLVPFMDEPLENPIHIGTYLMAKRARELGIKSIITGDGADEFFLGYQRFEPWFKGNANPGSDYMKWLWTMKPSEADHLYTDEAKELLRPMRDSQDHPVLPFSDIHQALRFERIDHLSEYHNNRVDRMTMAHGVEARLPFQDHRIVEYSLRIPLANHYGTSGKAWLRKTAEPWLPPEIINRQKIHFPSLPDKWLSGKGADWAAEILLDQNARTRKWIKSAVLEHYINEHKNEIHTHGRVLWSLVVLELFLQNLPSWRNPGQNQI